MCAQSFLVFAAGPGLLLFAQLAAAQSSSSACDLPKDLQTVVESKYPGTKVVSLSDLSEDDKNLFQKGHADSCPGMVRVDFYSDDKPTFALALITKSEAYPRTKLVLAHEVAANGEVSTLEKTDGPTP